MKTTLRTTILALLLLMPVLGHGEVIDRIIAIVNDDIITLNELEKHVRVEKSGRFVSVNEYLTNIKLGEKIDLFIDDLLIRQQAKKLKIQVSDKEVDAIIENIKKQYLINDAGLKEQLKKENITYEDFIVGLRTNLLRSRVLTRVISPEVIVSEKDLQAYYDTHKDEYADEEYRLQQIFVSGQRPDARTRAEAAFKRLQEGKSFESVVKEFSDDTAGAGHDGDIGFVKKSDLIPQLREGIGPLTVGIYTSVIATPYGFHILKLLEKKSGETMAFEAAKESIHEKIVQEESEKRYKDYVSKLRKASYIEVKI
ncbi:MAG: Chaperone SurA precursor [Syntrophorhabdus sp. PtaU1.Bin002]|nr:MAG: Chaperone SurA precursor [Syntrophorhabdus sp. PtaU1.Bin002]